MDNLSFPSIEGGKDFFVFRMREYIFIYIFKKNIRGEENDARGLKIEQMLNPYSNV